MDFEPIVLQYTKINVVSNPFSLPNNTHHCIAVRSFLCIKMCSSRTISAEPNELPTFTLLLPLVTCAQLCGVSVKDID